MQEMQETWVWSLGQEFPLGEEIITLSNIFSQRIWPAGNSLSSVQFSCSIVSDSLWLHEQQHTCGERALPLAKVLRKEAWHTQRRDRASRVSLEILEHLPPKTRVCLLSAFTYTSDFTGGCPPLPLSEKRVNLQLQLIMFLGVIVFQPTNSFGSPLACLNRFFRPQVIAQSLPTVRGMRCSKLSKYRFLWAVKSLIRNCIGEGIFTCWANVYC